MANLYSENRTNITNRIFRDLQTPVDSVAPFNVTPNQFGKLEIHTLPSPSHHVEAIASEDAIIEELSG